MSVKEGWGWINDGSCDIGDMGETIILVDSGVEGGRGTCVSGVERERGSGEGGEEKAGDGASRGEGENCTVGDGIAGD